MHGDPIPFCITPFAYNIKTRAIYFDCTFGVSFLVVIIYGIANFKFRSFLKHLQPTANTLNLEAKRRMLISLSVIMVLYILTQLATFVTLLSSQIFLALNSYMDLIYHFLGVLMALNVSSNFVVYWWRNTEYRKVFVQLLHRFGKRNAIFVNAAK
ncbi:unnamed protein product [Cylicocyclus nassatus]|uniref:G-protein coupled receptors family 1 profile domain-containing protein n=1 Tax=Cylicocyclus nassatus TaxID=53992 RepID=A0AA36DKG3_CYLNA|nr:unnamed protein product [Cylicocyclus nassatus]